MAIGKTIQSAVLPLPQIYQRWQDWANALLMLLKQQEAQADNPSTFTPSTGEGSVPYSLRLNKESGRLTYIGEAEPGSAEGDAVWRIKRLDQSGDPELIVLWADGNENFDNAWTGHTGHSYS